VTTKNLDTLVLLAQQSADMEPNDPLVGTTEWQTYVNDGLRELYLAYLKCNTDAYLKNVTFAAIVSGNTIPLPADFLKSRGLDRLAGANWTAVPVFNFRERNTYTGNRRAHRIDSLIRLDPEALTFTGDVYRLWYWPQPPTLNDTIPGTTDLLDLQMDLWSEYVIAYAAMRGLVKAKLEHTSQDADMSRIFFQDPEGGMSGTMTTQATNRDSESEQAPDAFTIQRFDPNDPGWY
jgi:hypothetical protein